MKRYKVLGLVVFFIISMSTVSVSGLFKYDGEGPTTSEIKNYLKENIDNEFSDFDDNKDLEEAATLTIKNTYIDTDASASLDEYFAMVHEDEMLENYVITTVSTVPLYHVDQNSKYVVGIINTDEQSSVLDIVFAENNDEGNVLKDEYYDFETGIAYISIFDLFKEENDVLYTDCVQAQLLRRYEDDNESEVSVQISCDDEIDSLIVSEDITAPEVIIPIDDNIYIEDVFVNGNETALEKDDYRISDDELILNTSSGNLKSVEVKANKENTTTVSFKSLFKPVDAYALSTDSSAITDIFGTYKKKAKVGDYVDFKAIGTNAWSAYGINYVQTVAGSATSHTSLYTYMINHYANDASNYVTGWYDDGKYKNIYRSTYNACYGIRMNTQDVTNYNSAYLKSFLSNISEEIQMGCIEVSTAAFQDMAINDKLNYTAMITAVGDDYIALTFCSTEKTSRGVSNQVMCGTYAIKYDPEPETVKVVYNVTGGYWPNNNHVEEVNVNIDDTYRVQYLSIEDEPKKDGYAFIGWTNDKRSDGVAKYDIGNIVKTASQRSGVKLYAVWKAADDVSYVYTDYGNNKFFIYDDPDNFEETYLPVPTHHYFKFDGYYTESGEKITDENGDFVYGDFEDIFVSGVFTNIRDVPLYAHFVDP